MARFLVLFALLCAAPAAGQITVTATVDEGSTVGVGIAFKNTANGNVTPDSASYEWRTLATDTVLVATTAFATPSSSVSILTPPMFIPVAEYAPGNPNSPDKITTALIIRYTWGGGSGQKSLTTWVYLRNVPGLQGP